MAGVDIVQFVNGMTPDMLPLCRLCSEPIRVEVSSSAFRDEIEVTVLCKSCDSAAVGGISGEVMCAADAHAIYDIFMQTITDVAMSLEAGVVLPVRSSYFEAKVSKEESKLPFHRKNAPWNV